MDQLLRPDEVAEMLNVTVEGLRRWRYNGKGPVYIRLGHRTLRYRPEDVQAWLDEQETGQQIGKGQ